MEYVIEEVSMTLSEEDEAKLQKFRSWIATAPDDFVRMATYQIARSFKYKSSEFRLANLSIIEEKGGLNPNFGLIRIEGVIAPLDCSKGFHVIPVNVDSNASIRLKTGAVPKYIEKALKIDQILFVRGLIEIMPSADLIMLQPPSL